MTAAGMPCARQSERTLAPFGPVRAGERMSQGSPIEAGGVPNAIWVPLAAANNSPIFGARTAR